MRSVTCNDRCINVRVVNIGWTGVLDKILCQFEEQYKYCVSSRHPLHMPNAVPLAFRYLIKCAVRLGTLLLKTYELTDHN